VVKLSACRDHILQGILTFLSIPYLQHTLRGNELNRIGNRGVNHPYSFFKITRIIYFPCTYKQSLFQSKLFNLIYTKLYSVEENNHSNSIFIDVIGEEEMNPSPIVDTWHDKKVIIFLLMMIDVLDVQHV
jgi:hypothetical protein